MFLIYVFLYQVYWEALLCFFISVFLVHVFLTCSLYMCSLYVSGSLGCVVLFLIYVFLVHVFLTCSLYMCSLYVSGSLGCVALILTALREGEEGRGREGRSLSLLDAVDDEGNVFSTPSLTIVFSLSLQALNVERPDDFFIVLRLLY